MVKNYKPRGFRVNGTSVQKIRAKTQNLRSFFNMQEDAYLNVSQLLDSLSAMALVDYDVVEDDEWQREEELAYFVPADNMIYIKRSTNDLATSGDGHSRFTIAHEIGHWMMHRNIRLSRSSISSVKHSPFEDSEWQADTFAAELLIYKPFVDGSDDALDLKRKFGVSTACAGVYLKREKRC